MMKLLIINYLVIFVSVYCDNVRHEHFSFICNSEEFNHDYMLSDDEVIPVKNAWNSAKVNETASLQHLCLQRNGLLLTRKCLFNPQRNLAEWEPIRNWTRVRCIGRTRERIVTPELNFLHEKLFLKKRFDEMKRRETIKDLRHILHKSKSKFLPADVYYTTQILNNIFENSTDVEISKDIVSICNSIMSMRMYTLRKSAEVNSTNAFLEGFENYMNGLRDHYVPSSRCKLTIPSKNSSKSYEADRQNEVESIDFVQHGVYAHLTANVSIFFINPTCKNITGIAVYDDTIRKSIAHPNSSKVLYQSKGNFSYRFLYQNESLKEIFYEPGVDAATFIPEQLWSHIQTQLPAHKQNIVIKFYAHDSLFVQTGGKKEACMPTGKIVSIFIPGYTARFPHPLPIFVRNKYYEPLGNKTLPPGSSCGYWNYQTWIKDDIETTSYSLGPMVLCLTKHLTQFSFLLGGVYRQNELADEILINPIHQRALNIISLVGCSFSLLGLIGIWITAAIFRNWRSMSSTKVLLNMCFALTVQMILFLFVNTKDTTAELIKEKAYYECIVLGALMQYSILVLFTWMLIIAFLQFQRYVTVVGIYRPSHYILKSAIIAWTIPLIPTLIVAFINPDGYLPSTYEMEINNAICYPSGYGLAFGVILPISVICIANLTIFIYVFCSISHTLGQTINRQEKTVVIKQIRLSVLLFFLLGLCWIFGIFSFLNDSIIFSYLFCLTASLQGFVLFMYFVVLADVPRKAWSELLCSRKVQKSDRKVQEMQSITASTAITGGNEIRKSSVHDQIN